MWHWLRRSFIAGFFVTVPLVVSVVTIVWVIRVADQLTSGLGERLFGVPVPGLGILATAAVVLLAGAVATNVFGRRVLQKWDQLLLQVPLFKTIYAPVKQLLSAFSPENEVGFKKMVLIEDPARGYLLGFLTKEFTIERDGRRETLLAVYVPTNHLYLGDVLVVPMARASFPDLTVEEGLRVFLSGGAGMPDRVHAQPADRID
jgi:uncharacterized membrane protein